MTVPTLADFTNTDCPVDVATRITRYADNHGTLPKALADLRRNALVQARSLGHRVGELATRTGVTPGRISRLTTEPTGADCPPWCEAIRHGAFDTTVDHHFRRYDEVRTSLMTDEAGEPATITVEIVQPVTGGDPEVAVHADCDTPWRLTRREIARLAQVTRKANSDLRTILAHLRRCKRPTGEAV